MAGGKHHNLNILLLKDEYESADEAIKEGHRIKKRPLKTPDGTPIGTLYTRSSISQPPKWTTFFEPIIDPYEIGENTNVSAALLIECEEQKYAITFGQGRYLLKPDSYVERFGLIVALNSIGKNKIRTISKSTFDAISKQTKEQASKETEASDFGLDVEQDLLRAVTGVPKDTTIGKRISGMDSLSISTKTKIENIEELLDKIYLKYIDNTYKVDFPWVDHISEIKDKTVTAQLEKDLITQISEGHTDRIWMAVPEFIDWDKVDGFCYSFYEKDPISTDIYLKDFLKKLKKRTKKGLTIETLKKQRVYCIDPNGDRIHDWPAYKCLYGELKNHQETYVISGAKWYVVESSFVKTVNKAFKEIPEYDDELPVYNDNSEDEYNNRVAAEMPSKYALMHRKNILFGQGNSPIEFCDLYSANRDIIHVKHYGNSSYLSHFFAQGRVSAESFKMEEAFRQKVAEQLGDGFSIHDVEEMPKTDEYQVVYAIISYAPGELDIPFFSRLNMKNSVRTLRGLGYRVAKAKIEMTPEMANYHKYKKRRKKKRH